MDTLISAGEFAKLASTTKRTVLFYDEKGVLKPTQVSRQGYRSYSERQILDYQRILLLSTLGVSLAEMKEFLGKNGDLSTLFAEKKELIQQEIRLLEFNLQNLTKYQSNLQSNGTMVNPEVKVLPAFGVYYIEKVGAYAQIWKYCEELLSLLDKRHQRVTTLAIFDGQVYQPRKSQIKIGALAMQGLTVKKEFRHLVQYMEYVPGKVLTYTHHGSGSLLSLFWKELEKYCQLHNIAIRKNASDFEIYRRVNSNVTKQFFEIYIPIE